MAEFESILAAVGGFNADESLITPPDAQNPFEAGDYRYARNVRIGSSSADNIGGVENLPSTLLVSTYLVWNGSAFVAGSAPAGTNKARGHYEDKDEGAIYWAVYNSGGNHVILKFDKTSRTIYELSKWSGYNFAATNIISMTKINKYLIFTCKDAGLNGSPNPPRMINVDEIAALHSTLGVNFSEYHVSFAKWAPLAPVQNHLVTGATANLYLYKGLFQFTYRYVYVGGFTSTWAPWGSFVTVETGSGVYALPDYFQVVAPGFLFDYETPANTYFQHSSIKFYEVVEFIEFGFRQSTKDPWKLFNRKAVVASGGNDNYTAAFRNNGPAALIAEIEIQQHFDSTPLFSETVEAIVNRPMFGNNEDDLLVDNFDVESVEVYNAPPTIANWIGPFDANYSGLSSAYRSILENRQNIQRFSFKERGIYKLGIVFQHWNGRTSLVKTTDAWTYLIPDGLYFYVNSAGSENYHALGFNIPSTVTPPDWAVSYQIVRSNCLNIEWFVEGIANDFVFLGVNNTAVTTDQINTPTAAQTIFNDYYNSQPGSDDPYPAANRIGMYYRNTTIVARVDLASQIYIDISNWNNASMGAPGLGPGPKPSNNVYYNFRKGDRVRFQDSDQLVMYDVEIVEFTGKGIIIDRPSGLTALLARANVPSWTASTWRRFLIEIYRPMPFDKSQEVTYYEMGEWYPITQPTTPSRDFLKRDFRWSGAANVTAITGSNAVSENFQWFNKFPIANGDVHLVNKEFFYRFYPTWNYSNTGDFIQMNQDKNNSVGFWEHNNGRPFVAYGYNPVKTLKPTQIRFGGQFLEDSVFININRFRDEWQFIYPSEYGTIRKLINTSNAVVETVGNVLLVIGEQEAWSIYVNRTTLEDLGGRTQVGLTDKVLGSYNTLLGSQGTLNPESVHTHNSRVIWWNVKKGVWNRYSRDGLTPISAFQMPVWFASIAKLIRGQYGAGNDPRVIATFDNFHNEWITRIDHSSLPSTFRGYASYKCASFAERASDKRWKSVYDYAPDILASLDNEVYSIIGAQVHIHEAGADYGKIYDSSVPSQIEFVANGDIRWVKDWRSVALIASDKWSFERIRGDWKSNSATIQETRIPLTSIENKEGTFWSEIKRDKNSVNYASEQDAVINGNMIKSKTLRLLLQLDPSIDYLSVLNWLIVSYDASPKNPKK